MLTVWPCSVVQSNSQVKIRAYIENGCDSDAWLEACVLQALETRIQKNIAKKGDSIKLKPVSAQKVSAHKSHQSPTK